MDGKKEKKKTWGLLYTSLSSLCEDNSLCVCISNNVQILYFDIAKPLSIFKQKNNNKLFCFVFFWKESLILDSRMLRKLWICFFLSVFFLLLSWAQLFSLFRKFFIIIIGCGESLLLLLLFNFWNFFLFWLSFSHQNYRYHHLMNDRTKNNISIWIFFRK